MRPFGDGATASLNGRKRYRALTRTAIHEARDGEVLMSLDRAVALMPSVRA